MKKVLLLFVTVLFAGFSSCSAQSWTRNDVLIPLNMVHTDAAFKQFKKASKMNQAEIVSELLSQANKAYVDCETIDEIRELRENVILIKRYLSSGKQAFMSSQKEYNILYNKINKTIREYEKGTTLYLETGSYDDFGQDLN